MLKLYLRPLLLGVAATVGGTFFMLAVFGPSMMAVFTIFLFLLTGVLLGKIQRHSLWYAPLLMNLPLWLRFPPARIDWLSLGLPFGALLSAYVGIYIGCHLPTAKRVSDRRDLFSVAKKYLVSLLLGILGMLIAYFLLFVFSFHLALSFGTANVLAFLISYPLLAAFLSYQYRDKWLASSIVVCMPPILYIYQNLLFNPNSPLRLEGRIQWNISFDDDTILLITLPITLLLSCLAGYLIARYQSITHEPAKPEAIDT